MDQEIEVNESSGDEDDNDDDTEDVPTQGRPVVLKLRKLIKKIRKSVQMRQKLRKCCEIYKMKYKVPKIDVKTRWNSTNEMIDRGDYLKAPLRALCNNEKTLAALQVNEWKILKKINKVLANFKRATQHISMERHPTITSYLPTFDFLMSVLCDRKNSFGQSCPKGTVEIAEI